MEHDGTSLVNLALRTDGDCLPVLKCCLFSNHENFHTHYSFILLRFYRSIMSFQLSDGELMKSLVRSTGL